MKDSISEKVFLVALEAAKLAIRAGKGEMSNDEMIEQIQVMSELTTDDIEMELEVFYKHFA